MEETRKENFFTKHKELLMEIVRFLIVGGLATLVDFLIYELFFYFILSSLDENLNLSLSTAAGFLVGNIVNFILSILFVFKGAREDKKTQSFWAFAIFTIIGILGLAIKIGCQNGGNFLMKAWFPTDNGFWSWFENTFVYCVATLIVLVWNYVGRKLFIFRKRDNKEN